LEAFETELELNPFFNGGRAVAKKKAAKKTAKKAAPKKAAKKTAKKKK
jgi:hypothetical protein